MLNMATRKNKFRKKHPGHQAKLMSEETRLKIHNNPDLTILYYLPEDHYIGITSCKKFFGRMHQHRQADRYTRDVEIMAYYERRVDAHLAETMYHVRGYNGFRDLTIRNK
jgi:hypothetical protein